MPDLSFQRSWYQPNEDTAWQLFEPKKKQYPVTFDFPVGFCDPDASNIFLLTGKILSKTESKSPQILFKMNRTTEVFHWDFRLGKTVHEQRYNLLTFM